MNHVSHDFRVRTIQTKIRDALKNRDMRQVRLLKAELAQAIEELEAEDNRRYRDLAIVEMFHPSYPPRLSLRDGDYPMRGPTKSLVSYCINHGWQGPAQRGNGNQIVEYVCEDGFRWLVCNVPENPKISL